tara:strand:+ start:1418 stop:2113 length:696 start_codon:yes stop_codon:yes gene_type:complete
MHFVFDVDGTLTPSRQPIDPSFQTWFLSFIQNNHVSLVTGSDIAKTREQLGMMITGNVDYCFNCSGSDAWKGSKNFYTSEWKLPVEAEEMLGTELAQSKFPLRTGLHFEHRPGMCNFSVVGRNATMAERKMYVAWDTDKNERVRIAKLFKKQFPTIEALVGGETGIDIFPKGKDKAQILDWIDGEIVFFGDRMDEDGNDYPLKKVIVDNNRGTCYHVSDYKETWEILRKYL